MQEIYFCCLFLQKIRNRYATWMNAMKIQFNELLIEEIYAGIVDVLVFKFIRVSAAVYW